MNAALARPWRSGNNGYGGGGYGGGGYGGGGMNLSPEQIAFLQSATPEQLAYLESLSPQCAPICAPYCPPDRRDVLKHQGLRKEGCPPMGNWNCGPNGNQGYYQNNGYNGGYGYNQYNNPWCPGNEPCQNKILSSAEIFVPPLATLGFVINTPEAFQGQRFYIVSSLAQYFRVNSLQIGSELIILNPMYADVLNEASNDVAMKLPTMTAGVTASGTVTNIDTVAGHPFIISLIGVSLCY